ncbi:hypothetical protein D3C78_1883480 [compost metagenome]
MPVAVPGQRTDTVTWLHTEVGQSVGNLTGTAAYISVSAAMDDSLSEARDDLRVRVRHTGVLKQ